MRNGKLTGMFDRAEATEAALVAASALGHGPVPHTESHAHD
jgi:erythritol transport system ATP-binding protein